MKKLPFIYRILFLMILSTLSTMPLDGSLAYGEEGISFLGPQSRRSLGEQRLLIVAVRFPDVNPQSPLHRLKKRVITDLNHYVKDQSYGLTWLKSDFKGWVLLPDVIEKYKVSPDNFKVDRGRVKKLIEDTMTAIENDVDFSKYQNMLIIPGAHTSPGKGYGMMCYCANPGMLTGVRRNPRFVTLRSRKGKEFKGGVFVGTENAPLGMFAHDLFHALGGVYQDKRLAPCLYNFRRQAEASRKHAWEYCTNYMGPWDVMSAHYVKRKSPPPGISSFTRIRLGWISAKQIKFVRPGETAYVSLSPLEKGGDALAIKIPLGSGQYYLLENRQAIGYDRPLPDFGLLILKVYPHAEEGSGTVRVMDANPDAPNFSQATFRLDRDKRNLFFDTDNDIAVIPLWTEGEKLGVLVTNGRKRIAALKSASEIMELMERFVDAGDERIDRLIEGCIESFKNLDFISCSENLNNI